MKLSRKTPAPRPGALHRHLFEAFLPRPSVPPEVLRRQISAMQDHAPLGLLVNVIVAITLGLSFMTPGRKLPELLWIVACVLLSGWRFTDCLRRRSLEPTPELLAHARRNLRLGAALQGVLWGIAGTLLVPASPLLQLFLIAVLSGMTAGAVLILCPIWSAYALFTVPAIIPLCFRLMGGPLPTQRLTGSLGLVYSLAMLFIAARISRWLEDSLVAVQEKDALARHLQSANENLVQYHARLEAAVAARTLELSEANARLQEEFAAKEEERLKTGEREEALRRAQKLESLGLLAGGIAHDFNNLLAAILGNLDLLQLQTPDGAPGRAYLGNMEKAVNRAAALTGQMLAYSGRGHFAIQNLDLNQTVGELASLLHVCISKRATLGLELCPGLPPIFGDLAQLQQVVMNLVTNASEALGDADGEIRIATRVQELDPAAAERISRLAPSQPGPHVLLEVSDTGHGMAPEVLARIFDPFFTTKGSGRGLGLSAMFGILRGHGAGIEISSSPQAGSTFRLYFPVSRQAAVPAAPLPEAHAGSFSGRVLVVDDEPTLLETAQGMLESLGLRVVTAADGIQAMEVMAGPGADINLVLLDLTMPRMDGRQTLRALRQLNPSLPVILTSGYDPRQSPAEARDLDGRAFLRKPYSLDQLRQALSAALAVSPG